MYDPNQKTSLSRTFTPRPTKTIYHIICEGLTEKGYLIGMRKKGLFLPHVRVLTVSKDGLDRDASDRMEMISILRDYEIYLSEGKNTLRRFITVVLDSYYVNSKEEYSITTGNSYKQFVEELCAFRSELMAELDRLPYVSDGFVVPNSGLMDAVSESCVSRFKIDYTWSSEDQLFDRDHADGKDVFCVMFDRDFHPELRTHEMYSECLSLCNELGYQPLVSTPQFELWMLMHFYGVNYGKPSFDRYKQYMLRQLQQFDYYSRTEKEKVMSLSRFEEYYQYNIWHAIETSKDNMFTDDVVSLMDHPGTNLGSFFEKIVKNDDGGI